MRTDITAMDLWENPSLRNFFMRSQSQTTFENVVDHFGLLKPELLDIITEEYESLDELESDFYETPDDELIAKYHEILNDAPESRGEWSNRWGRML